MSAVFRTNADPVSTRVGPRKRIWGALLGILAALPASLWLWGFTVDDALISARVAAHIARGLGPRFNPHGPVVDAVTPLGFAQFLSLFGQGDVLATFQVAKCLGLAAWLVAAAVLGALIAGAGQSRRRFSPLLLVAVSAPLGAWAVSGMETGLVTLLATLGLLDGVSGALPLGLAAALRPELAPFSFVLVAARARFGRASLPRGAALCGIVALPLFAVALIREHFFGRVVPLSFFAKPSDFGHGLQYALGAFAFSGLPWLLLATPKELRRTARAAWPLLAALAAHFFALVLCGGDWMALYRLAVPVLPCAALAGAYIADPARPVVAWLRLALGLAAALLLAVGLGAPARRVGAERRALIAEARPVFAHDPRIAALDVGWVGAASDAEVIDLAGVTDPEVAFFPGGHTSKRIPRAWLFRREPTAIVLLLARSESLEPSLADSRFSRAVEQRVAELVATEFRVRRTLALGDQSYVVLEPMPTEPAN
ncbi:MAG TPA: hypothetical protein VNW92_15660 [Polyangiaceae bacterium]|nr:hypothetical protein [Polyangiaceae bacterium]